MDAPLPQLPLPVIERDPQFTTFFNSRIAQMQGLMQTAGIAWTSYQLRSDPLNNLCRHAAYGDLLYANSLNDTFRATLLDFADGADLVAQASDWDLTPFTGEADDDLRRRLRERKKGQGGFSDNWYVRWAFAADPRVADVGIIGDGKGGVTVSILSSDNGGVASADLLAIVNTALNQPLIKGDNDTITVVPAVITIVNITANVWLLPEAADTEYATAQTALTNDFNAARRLGWDFSTDFAVASLRTSGVSRIVMVTPASDTLISVAPNEAVALGVVTLNPMGRSY
jgi:phage-related baseplate assembly protein